MAEPSSYTTRWGTIWETAVQVARLGAPCMLELGFGSRERRATYASLAETADLPVRFHLLDAPLEERWKRVQGRNEEVGPHAQLSFAVTREMFDFTEAFWDPPTDEEMELYNGIRVVS